MLGNNSLEEVPLDSFYNNGINMNVVLFVVIVSFGRSVLPPHILDFIDAHAHLLFLIEPYL